MMPQNEAIINPRTVNSTAFCAKAPNPPPRERDAARDNPPLLAEEGPRRRAWERGAERDRSLARRRHRRPRRSAATPGTPFPTAVLGRHGQIATPSAPGIMSGRARTLMQRNANNSRGRKRVLVGLLLTAMT